MCERPLVVFVEPSPVWMVERRGIRVMKSSSISDSSFSGRIVEGALVPLRFTDLCRILREPVITLLPKSICIAKKCGISLLINSASSGNA